MSAAQDGAPDTGLEAHVAGCAECRRIRDDLAVGLAGWRQESSRVSAPDPEREWHAVRRRIRAGADVRPRRNLIPWLALPVGAAAAVALALFVTPEPGRETAAPQTARAYSVEVPANTSTMVFVDEKSGWLIVWANDAAPQNG